MDENHQDKADNKPIVTEDVRWVFSKKSKLWVSKRKGPTGFEDKTLWDKLNLFGTLAIPLIIALATIGFGLLQLHLADAQHLRDQQSADLQHKHDQQQALDQQQATILQKYLDNIQDLLLNHNLLKPKSSNEVAILARARTLTALQGLDPERKGRLLIFLYEAALIGFEDTNGKMHDRFIELFGADLSQANLYQAYLTGAYLLGANLSRATLQEADLGGATLQRADLSGANLTGAYLWGAHLIGANLTGATLIRAQLPGADLWGAHLWGANLSYADLSYANLTGADLSGADLSYANLFGADLSQANLGGANLFGIYDLTQQQLDQVYTCKDAILPKGLICHHNP